MTYIIGHIDQTVDAWVDQAILDTIVDVFLFVVAAVFYALTIQFPGDTSIVQLAMQNVLREGSPLPS